MRREEDPDALDWVLSVLLLPSSSTKYRIGVVTQVVLDSQLFDPTTTARDSVIILISLSEMRLDLQ